MHGVEMYICEHDNDIQYLKENDVNYHVSWLILTSCPRNLSVKVKVAYFKGTNLLFLR